MDFVSILKMVFRFVPEQLAFDRTKKDLDPKAREKLDNVSALLASLAINTKWLQWDDLSLAWFADLLIYFGNSIKISLAGSKPALPADK